MTLQEIDPTAALGFLRTADGMEGLLREIPEQ